MKARGTQSSGHRHVSSACVVRRAWAGKIKGRMAVGEQRRGWCFLRGSGNAPRCDPEDKPGQGERWGPSEREGAGPTEAEDRAGWQGGEGGSRAWCRSWKSLHLAEAWWGRQEWPPRQSLQEASHQETVGRDPALGLCIRKS